MSGGSTNHLEILTLEDLTVFAKSQCLEENPSTGVDAQVGSPGDNLAAAFLESASLHGHQPALTTSTGSWRYADLQDAALTLCERLKQSPSFALGSRVVLLLNNSPEYLAAFYGTLMAGGVVVPLSPRIEQQQFRDIRQSTAARHVVTQPRIARIWNSQFQSINTEVDESEPGSSPADIPTSKELAAVFFTGGSSGTPKGVMLSHRNLIANARSIQNYLNIQSTDRPLCVLPFYHAFGNSVLQSHLLAGSQLIIDGNTTFPETLIDAISHHQATSLSGVPDLFRFLLERTSLGKRLLPSLRYLAVAGGSLPHDLALEVARKSEPSQFYVMYGQTEATARLAYIPPDHLQQLGSGCIGKAVPGMELEVVDPTGMPVPTGAVGEIRARGPGVMLGYWREPELTREVIRDGWLHTGDLGSVDQQGWIYHRGRRNALIKIAGYRIHPSDIEDFVTRSLPIQQAVVVPYEAPGLGTRLALFARPRVDNDVKVLEIVARCRADLPRHMVPDYVQLVEQFPLNEAMKIDRPRLISLAVEAATQRRKTA